MKVKETSERAAKRVALNMKATPRLRALIDEAAANSGLSVAQEVERRLIESLEEERRLGGDITAQLARTIAGNIRWIEQSQGARWYDDETCFRAVATALPMIMQKCRRSPLPEVVDEIVRQASVELAFRSMDALDESRDTYRPAESLGDNQPFDEEV